MHRTRSSSPRALYTSLEVAEVRDTCVPPRNTYSPNPHELTTYDTKHTYALPIQHTAMRYTLAVYEARYDGRSPGHCAVTDRWIVPINKREGVYPVSSLISSSALVSWLAHVRGIYLPTYTLIARWWRWSSLFINASSLTFFLRIIMPDRCGEIREPEMDEETKQEFMEKYS